MGELSIKESFGGLLVHLKEPLSQSDTLILGVPGGPCLSGRYLDPFLSKLGDRLKCNAAMLDLPNHDNSQIQLPSSPLQYPDCLAFLTEAISAIAGRCSRVVLYGQSFGARLVFDLVQTARVRPAAVILSGFPYTFQSSEAFYAQLENLNLENMTDGPDIEDRFARNWRKILPLNTVQPLNEAAFHALSSGTRWTGNEHTLEECPAIEAIVSASSTVPPLLICEGDRDPVVPDKNIEFLRNLVPTATFRVIAKTGHFPMIEAEEATLTTFCDFLSEHLK